MAYLTHTNNAISTLDGNITDVAVTLDVQVGDGALFPAAFDFHISVEDEIMVCTNRVGDTLTITRSAEGTSNVAHADGVTVELRITSGVLDAIETEIDTKIADVVDDASPQLGADLDLNSHDFTSAAAVAFKVSGDADDYLTIATVSNIPTLYGTGAYLRIGDGAAASHGLASEDDLLCTGKLEVNGVASFDGEVAFFNTVGEDDDKYFRWGTNFDAKILYETADADAKILLFTIDESDDAGNNVPAWVFSEETNALNVDLGLFDGIVEASIIALANAGTTYTLIDNAGLLATGSVDSAAVADQVRIGGYEIGAGNRVIAISSETVVAAEVDETKFSHKLQVRINGATYYLMLTAT